MKCTCSRLHALFPRLTDFGIGISPLKCEFGANSMEFLGHLINQEGIAPLPENVAAMRLYETPTTAKGLRHYLGMINFYMRFAPSSAETLLPLYHLLKNTNSLPKNAKISWNSDQLEEFKKSKTDLATPPIRRTLRVTWRYTSPPMRQTQQLLQCSFRGLQQTRCDHWASSADA